MLEINPGLILWTIITFLLLVVVLRAVAWKPLLGALTAREQAIKTSLEDAERARDEARRLLEENARELARAEERSQSIIREGRELGERLKAEILEKAESSGRHMVEQAQEEIRREKQAALVQLRTEVADLALLAAGKMLDANLDTPKQRQLVEAAINSLQKS